MTDRYWPLTTDRRVTSPFGWRGSEFHTGVDFGRDGGSGGMPVYAVQSGTVIHAGAAQGYGGPDPCGWLVIDSDDSQGGGVWEYGHIRRLPDIRVGSKVVAGQQIAVINPDVNTNGGSARDPIAPHLHLSYMPREYNQKAKADPLPRLAGAKEPPSIKEKTVGWTGDPIWLADVLRSALGDRLVVEPGWDKTGTGEGVNGTVYMGQLWGVMIHHTGNDREKVAVIRDGRPDLAGPLSQCLIKPDGTCHLIAIGPCNHGGYGSYPGVPGQANTSLIGFECAWPTVRPDGTYDEKQRWPDAQIITMRDATAAVLAKLGYDASHVIGHKEWAKSTNIKWDPGNIDMAWFRAEVAKALRGDFKAIEPKKDEPAPVSTPAPTPTPAPVPKPADPVVVADRTELEWLAFIGDDTALIEVLRLADAGDSRAILVINYIDAIDRDRLELLGTKG